MTPFDVRILGTGIVSRAAALSLARIGLNVALQARPAGAPASTDVRTYALNPSSVQLLERLRAWSTLPEDARTAVLDMQVQGDAHASRIEFSAWRQAVPALAWIVDAGALENVLDAAAGFAPQVTLQAGAGPRAADPGLRGQGLAQPGPAGVALRAPRLWPHRGGRPAGGRPAARGCARQWFRAPDILGLLPFDRPEAGCSYGLVWSLPQSEAQRWLAASPEEFEAGLMAATGGEAGQLRLAGERPPGRWPWAMPSPSPARAGPCWATPPTRCTRWPARA
jgi:2-polyprenyl-6-methoxyphenol hydroxylase-like FAD-dependent oxidoreductase